MLKNIHRLKSIPSTLCRPAHATSGCNHHVSPSRLEKVVVACAPKSVHRLARAQVVTVRPSMSDQSLARRTSSRHLYRG